MSDSSSITSRGSQEESVTVHPYEVPDSINSNAISGNSANIEVEATKKESGDKFSNSILLSNILENKGTVARDHLSNERTFLSWISLSLGFLAIGIGLVQFYRMERRAYDVAVDSSVYDITKSSSEDFFYRTGKSLGSLCLALSILAIFFGLYRYLSVQSLLIKDQFPVTRALMFILLMPLFALWSIIFAINIKFSVN